jgi:hypothetical protein
MKPACPWSASGVQYGELGQNHFVDCVHNPHALTYARTLGCANQWRQPDSKHYDDNQGQVWLTDEYYSMLYARQAWSGNRCQAVVFGKAGEDKLNKETTHE